MRVFSQLFLLLIAIALLSIICQSARAQSRPAPGANAVSPQDSLESQPISGDTSKTTAKSASPSAAPSTFDPTRVLLSLIGVVTLIFVLCAAAKRFFPGAAPVRAISAVKILARCPVSPKQHLLVVQFGKRLVLVGDTGARLNPLCEISDPDEAAAVVAQAREQSISVAKRFDSFFGLARKAFGESPAPEDQREDHPTEDQPVVHSQERPEESFDQSHEIISEESSLEATRKELAGLSEKVRDVARQLGSA